MLRFEPSNLNAAFLRQRAQGLHHINKRLFMIPTDLNQNAKPIINITENQRLISGISGGLLLAMGIFGFGKSSFRRALRMTAGSLLIFRGITGYCPVTAMRKDEIRQRNQEEVAETAFAGEA